MHKQKLFAACCVSLLTTSVAFSIRGDIADPLMRAFHITNQQLGVVYSPVFWGFCVAVFIGGAVLDEVGAKRIHILSALGYIVGVLLVLFAPRPAEPTATVLTSPEFPSLFSSMSTSLLYVGFIIMGLSQGLVESVINPLTVTIYDNEKTKKLNQLHAWWPGGLIIGGLLAVAMTSYLQASWQLKLSLVMIPAVVYLAMALMVEYPKTERAVANVSYTEMWKQIGQPLFLLFWVCMWMTAAAELGPDQWFPAVMGRLVPQLNPSAGSGILFLVYTAGLMFVLRTWFSGVSHKSPVGTLIVSAVMMFVGLYWMGGLSEGSSALTAITAATIFGIGKTYVWPTMLGFTSEQFPKGGALLISIMGGTGMLSVGLALPIMGAKIDQYAGGTAAGGGAALRMMSWLGVVLFVIFSGVWVYFKARGGYRAVHISEVAAGK